MPSPHFGVDSDPHLPRSFDSNLNRKATGVRLGASMSNKCIAKAVPILPIADGYPKESYQSLWFQNTFFQRLFGPAPWRSIRTRGCQWVWQNHAAPNYFW